jgi:hypothetical protein
MHDELIGSRRTRMINPANHIRSVLGIALMLAGPLAATPVLAQSTSNSAPRISLAGSVQAQRAETLCARLAPASDLGFEGLSIADADVGEAVMHARVELEPGAGSNASVRIPGLADLPGVTILRESPDRIRFNAPLSSVNAAFAVLEYRGASTGDMLDLIADDLQLPPLSAEIRLHVSTDPDAVTPSISACRPPPDLRPESDSGASDEDDITVTGALLFDVRGVQAGDVIDLLNDDVLIGSTIAQAGTVVVSDPAPVVDATALYAVSVNGDAGSAAWSVAVVAATLFADGFEAAAAR